MNLSSIKTIKQLFQKYQTKPIKRLGQNFLIDKGVIKKIIETANLKPSDTILEIGPGIGTLTQEIAKRVKKIIAVEKDPKMVEILNELLDYSNIRNVKIIKGDILKLDPIPYTLKPYKIVANLPYYIVSPIIRKFLELENPPKEMILMVQKEVGQRICAKPGKMSILAVSVQFYAEPKIISYVSKKSFWPQPKVDSAIIRIDPQININKKTNKYRFFRIVKAGFSQPRKQLVNNLTKELKIDKLKIKEWLLKNKIQPTQRAETLTLSNWTDLTKSFKIFKIK